MLKVAAPNQEPPFSLQKIEPHNPPATRYERFLAVIIDMVINITASLPFIFYIGLEQFRDPSFILILSGLLYGVMMVLLVHGYLLHHHAQTIGKALMSIRIENLDGSKASIWKIVFLRMLPMSILGQIPILGQLLAGFVNPLFIFTRSRRCLHDYLAATQVSHITS